VREPQVQFRSKDLMPTLEERAGRSESVVSNSEVARADLFRYYHLLDRARSRMCGHFTLNELNVVAGANVYHADSDRANFLVRTKEEIQNTDLTQRWPINEFDLMSKLQRLSEIDMLALIDAIECFWNQRDGAAQSSEDFFERLGLLTN
jgi:hypothetical protein